MMRSIRDFALSSAVTHLTSSAKRAASLAAVGGALLAAMPAHAFTLEQVMGFTHPVSLVRSPRGERIGWVMVLRGERSLWVADGPEFQPRRLVGYGDDGQELTNLAFSGDGRYLVYVRGGNHAANAPAPGNLMPNPTSSPVQPRMQVWSVAVSGGSPVLLSEGDEPAPSPTSDRVAFRKDREIWSVPVDGSKPAARLFFARGTSQSPVWASDGRTLAFVSNRGDYSYIALYTSDDQPIRYLEPTTSQDSLPRWSPDGTRIAFVRRPGRGGAGVPPLEGQPDPWSIWVGDVQTAKARTVWQGPETSRGSYPRTLGGANLHWAAGDRLVFLADVDGWPHLYSVSAVGGNPTLLTPGRFMVEYVSLSPDRKSVVYNANTGPDRDDSERRHVFRVPVEGGAPTALSTGKGIEWAPVVTAGGSTLAYIASDAQQPPLVHVRALAGGDARPLNAELVAPDFPVSQLVTPEHVVVTAPDGTLVHCQLFRTRNGPPRRPAVVFVHGGPARQMLLAWDYLWYYAYAYGVHQYLASRGFVVLSVNYRLGIGYGHDFHHPQRSGPRGASEYQDVLAAGKYLQSRPDVDPARIGIWGGSYGGYLTALALGRNSDVFAAGVDLHGRHDFTNFPSVRQQLAAALGDGIGPDQLAQAMRTAWESSPTAWVKTWRSPVLFVHGDDDRNVPVEQTVDLVQRLRRARVPFEEMVIPDEIHSFLLYRSWMRVNGATVDFFSRTLARGDSENGR